MHAELCRKTIESYNSVCLSASELELIRYYSLIGYELTEVHVHAAFLQLMLDHAHQTRKQQLAANQTQSWCFELISWILYVSECIKSFIVCDQI